MPSVDPRVDDYIEKCADFARPILLHLRKLIHKACPDVVETLKWSMPHFDHKGPLCHMAGFKKHCAFGFWKESLLDRAAAPADRTAMGTFGRIASMKDLPPDKLLLDLIRQAVELNEKGVKLARKPAAPKKDLVVPEDLTAALARDRNASTAFKDFSYSHRKEYIEWINEAKTQATRDRRLAKTLEMLREGKSRNWKYERK